MVMPRLGVADETPPQQPLPVVRVCWDELFEFLRSLFHPKAAKAWTALNNLDAETSTNYKEVLTVVVPASFEGILDCISLYSSRPDATQWQLEISGQEQFTDKKIYVTLSLDYGGLVIHTDQKIFVKAKTDGTATDIVAVLSGQLRYLGK